MQRAIGITMFATAAVCGLAYMYRDNPAIARFLLADTPTAEATIAWPPVLGKEYPDLQLIDQTGNTTRLSDFRGKVLLVEMVGIPCGACQAFSGGRDVGAFRGGSVQANLDSIEVYAERYGKFDLDDDRIVFVQLLLFDEKIYAPTSADAAAWAEHFGMERSKNQIVLVGTKEMATRQSYDMIPGFHLIDRDFKFDRDSAGHNPKHNLYKDLLPRMRELVEAAR
ncbi:MAG: hypothetical protein WD875_04715 [Pirellulales bacterium]